MVRKTQGRPVYFPAASIQLVEVQRHCKPCKRVWRPPEYHQVAAPGANHSHALKAFVGHQRFQEHHQLQRIGTDLRGRGVRVSKTGLLAASHWYLEGFAALHGDARLWTVLLEGKPVHWKVDGTMTQEGAGLVWVVESHGYTVVADGVASEKDSNVVPVLEEALRRTGPPCAVERDGSRGEEKAIRTVAPEAVQVECQFHFPRDVGKDLMGPTHVALGKALADDHHEARLRRVALHCPDEWGRRVAAVVDGIFDSKRGLAFPFRIPALDRVRAMDDAHAWAKQALRQAAKENRSLPAVLALREALDRYRLEVAEPTAIAREVRRLANRLERWAPWFDQLREELRRFREGPQDAKASAAVAPLLDCIEKEARELGGEEGQGGLDLVAAVRGKWDVLFSPVVVDDNVVRLDRTIVDTEQGHGAAKRGIRRRTGKARVDVAMRHHGVGLRFLGNWERAEFQNALGGWPGLVGTLATQDPARRATAAQMLARLRPPPGWISFKKTMKAEVAQAAQVQRQEARNGLRTG